MSTSSLREAGSRVVPFKVQVTSSALRRSVFELSVRLDALRVVTHAHARMASVGSRPGRSAKSRVRAGMAAVALMVVATIVPACGSYYETRPPEGFGFKRVGGPRSSCYLSALLPDPIGAVDRLVKYYNLHMVEGGESGPVYARGYCQMSMSYPVGKRPNAYGWVGRNDPPIGYPTQIFLWVTPLHPRGPAQLHLIIDTSAGGQNLP